MNNKNVDRPINIMTNNETIESVNVIINLGFMLYSKIKMTNHIDYLCDQIAKKLDYWQESTTN